MFNRLSNTAFNNTPFSFGKLCGMSLPNATKHPSLERLMTFAQESSKAITGHAALAAALIESEQTVTNWARRGVSKTGAMKAQSKFGCSANWVLTGQLPRLVNVESFSQSSVEWANVEPRILIGGSIPLISWIRAGDFCESPDNFEPGDAEEHLPRPLQNMGKHVFALTVRGDSMNTPDGYREGEIVYIDPDKSPVSGSDVVARVDNKLNLKRYKEDQEGPYLLQLNGNIIIRPKGEWSVCGVVVFSGKRR